MSEKLSICEKIGQVADTFVRYYANETLALFTSGLHNRAGQNPLASNPGVQLLQSKWRTAGKAAPIAQPRNRLASLWRELVGESRSDMSESQREHVMLDVLVTRSLVPSVSLMGMFTLGELPVAKAKAACIKRVGKGPGEALYKFAKAGHDFLAATHELAEPVQARRSSSSAAISPEELLGIAPEGESA